MIYMYTVCTCAFACVQPPPYPQGDVWICMELLDASMDKISKRVTTLGQSIPEEILGKMTVAVIKALYYLKDELKIIHRGLSNTHTHIYIMYVCTIHGTCWSDMVTTNRLSLALTHVHAIGCTCIDVIQSSDECV